MIKLYLKKVINKMHPLIQRSIMLIYSMFLFCFNKECRKEFLRKRFFRERKICLGNENADKCFYIIRRASNYAEGHFSMISFILGHLKIADDRNMIPIIDMKSIHNPLWQSLRDQGKENSWEYFYKQPTSYNLDDIKSSKNIILCNGIKVSRQPLPLYINDNHEIRVWNSYWHKYIMYNEATKLFIDKMISSFRLNERRIIAVSIRRGIEWGQLKNDYLFRDYNKHPSIDEVIHKVQECLITWNCDFIFLVIDDQEGLELFKKVFKERLLYIKRDRWIYFENGIPVDTKAKNKPQYNKSQKEVYSKELRFLTEVIILSKCNSIVCSKTTANTIGLVINGNNYENTYIFNTK